MPTAKPNEVSIACVQSRIAEVTVDLARESEAAKAKAAKLVAEMRRLRDLTSEANTRHPLHFDMRAGGTSVASGTFGD